jgi:peptide/nickel transport system substrate-binding protein
MKSVRHFAAVLLTGAALCLACLAARAEGPTTLRIGIGEDPDVLDPARSRLFASVIVMRGICDSLLRYTDRRFEPALATGYRWSEDGRALTMSLRAGVRFQDGEPFDAAAVKYNVERSLNLPDSTAKTYLGPISGVETPDQSTITIRLSSPFAPLLAALAGRVGMMVSPKAAEAAGEKFGGAPVCAGPFRFVDRVVHDRITVERFAD